MLTDLPLRSPNWVSWEHSVLPSPGDVPLASLLPPESLSPQPARTSPPLTRTAATAIPRRLLRDRMRAFLSGLSAGPSSPRAFETRSVEDDANVYARARQAPPVTIL